MTHLPLPPPPPPTKSAWTDHQIDGINVLLRAMGGPRRAGVPVVDEGYKFRENLVREIAWAVWPHDEGAWSPCALVGPKGCGKTSLVEQLAARCNIPVYRVNLNVGTTVRHLKGKQGAKDGSTVFLPGIITTAMEEGAWLILDEISGATPPVALSLFPILEPNGAVLLEDAEPPRYVKRHPDFRIFATDNTIGADQEANRFSYAGTNPDVNEALLDRFDSTVQVGYLPPEDEHVVAKIRAPGIQDLDLAMIIRVANSLRKSDAGFDFSHRMVVSWARRVGAGFCGADGSTRVFSDTEIYAAAGPAFLDKMRSRVERDAIQEVIRRVLEITEGGEK
jgi:hypothetical protein